MSDLRSPPPGSGLVEAHERARRAKLSAAGLQEVVNGLQGQLELAERRLEAVLGTLSLYTGDLEPVVATERSGKLPEATALMLLSDTHPGERVRPSEVLGTNEYSPAIYQARMEQFANGALRLVEAARQGWDVRRGLLWLGGDLMTGWIHEEYVAENYLSPQEELFCSFEATIRLLDFMLQRFDFEQLDVVTSCGNHGRDTKKMWSAGAFRTSYEFTLYRMLAHHFRDEPRLRWKLGEGYETHHTVYGRRIGFQHGHEIQYNGGVGGIAPALYRRLGKMAGSDATRTHLMCIAHHHSLGFPPGVITNGSLIGPTAYGIGKGFAPEEPMQAFGILDAKHRVLSAMSPIFCREARRGGRK